VGERADFKPLRAGAIAVSDWGTGLDPSDVVINGAWHKATNGLFEPGNTACSLLSTTIQLSKDPQLLQFAIPIANLRLPLHSR